jgi:hypothetical protein
MEFVFLLSDDGRIRDSSVGKGWKVWVRFSFVVKDFSLIHSVYSGSGVHPDFCSMIAELFSTEVKLPGRKANHSPSVSDKVKNGGAIFALPNTSWWSGAELITLPLLYEWFYRLCGLVVRVLGYRSGGPGSIPGTTRKKRVVGLERGPLNLMSTTEELLDKKNSGSCLENREYGHRDPSADHVAPFIRKNWQSLRLQAAVARSV